MTHHLFLVSREAPEVARFLAAQFPPDSYVRVVLDRREGERRTASSQTAVERRAGDRRKHTEVEAELRVRSHVFLTLAGTEG